MSTASTDASTGPLLRTALIQAHRRAAARLVDFAGWEMPVQYAGIIAEHTAVRTARGIFDLSHMGRVFLRGADAMALAQDCATRDLARLRPGEAAYSLLCRDDGAILDDVIAYVLGPEEVLFVVNASNREKDLAFFSSQRDARGLDTRIEDRTFETALIGVQGPRAQAALQAACEADLEPLAGYGFVQTRVNGAAALGARTGYTGEDGFELMVAADDAESVWDTLLRDAVPCGLGARDTLRTEAGFPLYGHEIDETTNPFEARLGWVVSTAKPDYSGRDALLALKAAGPRRRLVGLHIGEGGVPRPGYPILGPAGEPLGTLTSGTFSPTLKRNIGIGYVPLDRAEPGVALAVEMRGRPVRAEVVPLPFVHINARPRAGKLP